MSIDELIELLTLERIEANLFRGFNQDIGSPSVFGGQVLGQAMAAASATVESHQLHSVHGYFLRGGDKASPIIFDVDRIRDGRSFTTRRVVAIQHGKAIFNGSMSFQLVEEGLSHQCDMPIGVPDPESLPSEQKFRIAMADMLPEDQREFFSGDRPIEMRPVQPSELWSADSYPPEQMFWMRVMTPVNGPLALHQTILAYSSDFYLIGTALRPHGVQFVRGDILSASLDHAMWFHRPLRVDEWLLYVMESPCASGARGFNLGKIYTRDGLLVASCAQEGFIRLLDTDKNNDKQQ
jgi:acyl-CoA thioesterase-2